MVLPHSPAGRGDVDAALRLRLMDRNNFRLPWDDQVAVVAASYPATIAFKDAPSWAKRINAPVVRFAGELDTYRNCCLIGKARQLARAAKSANAPFELTTYPATNQDFVIGGSGYKPYGDALARTQASLKWYLGS
jgi:hypothetical protein